MSDLKAKRNSKNVSITEALKALLVELGEDIERTSLLETPARFEKHLREATKGYQADPDDFVKLFDNEGFHDLVVVSSISFSSLCEHHLLPFYGYVDIAYVPGSKILGLSKFARIIDVFSLRLQVQERLTQEIADFLNKRLEPGLLMVRVSAVHTCMTARGVNRPQSKTDTFIKIGADTEANKNHVRYFQQMKGVYDNY